MAEGAGAVVKDGEAGAAGLAAGRNGPWRTVITAKTRRHPDQIHPTNHGGGRVFAAATMLEVLCAACVKRHADRGDLRRGL
jgi:hypothetical protein